jgi:hypothetical protein
MPLGLLLVTDRKQCDWCAIRVSEASLAQGGECHMRHLLDGVVQVTSNDGSGPQCHGSTGIST